MSHGPNAALEKNQNHDANVLDGMSNRNSNIGRERVVSASSEAAAVVTYPGNGTRAVRLWTEFLILFIALPVIAATLVSPKVAISAFIVMTIVGIGLLFATDGFRWRSLIEGRIVGEWPLILIFTLGTTAVAAAIVLWLVPYRFLSFPQEMPGLWLRVMILYPLLSVLPQEIFFRVLFFHRYGHLFPDVRLAIAVNAVCFGLAHAFFANWPAVVLTAIGGAFFAWAYVVRRSFGLTCVLHALAGQIIFTVGLGLFFYHGAVGTI